MDAFLYDIYRIQFKCKLCKDNNICYKNVHHISVPEFMDAFFYSIYRIQFKCKLCKDNTINVKICTPTGTRTQVLITFVMKFYHISVPEFMDAFLYGIYSERQ